MTTSSVTKNTDLPDWLKEWWPVLLGLIALYVPTFYNLANGVWNSEDQAHGPLVLIMVLYLFWQKREALSASSEKSAPVFGLMVLVFGALFYAVGRSQAIVILEIGSLPFVILGMLLALRGWKTARSFWFAIFFMFFLIPTPGFIVDILTNPLKMEISKISENLLYWFGYPISRSGVTIYIGQYQLLVADACAGLHSMFSLSALGILYLYMMQRRNVWRNAFLIASILPIAFVANVLRVIVLILITYYLGDEAGQGFLHGFAGIVLFLVALMSLFFLDYLLGMLPLFADSKTPGAASDYSKPLATS